MLHEGRGKMRGEGAGGGCGTEAGRWAAAEGTGDETWGCLLADVGGGNCKAKGIDFMDGWVVSMSK